MFTVSIIIPVFNTEEFIDRCLTSVTEQTYKHLEIILINDGSDTSCKQRLEDWVKKDGRLKLYHLKTRHGVGYARNFGLKQATGTYIYFLDSDDYIAPNTIQLLIENIGHLDIISGKKQQTHLDPNLIEQELNIQYFNENKFALLNNSSVLNRLIKRSLIERHQLKFIESVERYSDLTFMIPAFLNTTVVAYIENALYFKRRRVNPQKNPALMQTGMDDRINDFYKIYYYIKEHFEHETRAIAFIEYRFIRIYKQAVVRYFRKNENVNSIFHLLVDLAKTISRGSLNRTSFLIRRELRCLKKDDLRAFKRLNLWHHRLRKLKHAVKNRRRLYIQFYRTFFLRLPIDERTVIFESFLGKSYSDSPKYIYEKMLEQDLNYKYVWSVDERKDIPGDPIQVKRFSLRYFYYMAIAKYWVSNARLPRFLYKRDEHIYLQTWHGTPLKRLAADMEEVHMPGTNTEKYKRNFIREARRWDYLISPNTYSTEIFKRAFHFENTMLAYGYPRNDILYEKNNDKAINGLKKTLNLPENKKIILYAPTWRDDEFYEVGKYKFSLKLNLDKLQSQLGDDYIILLRMHYLIASKLDISAYDHFVYDFSHYDDIAELYLVSDILITDYSSVFFDFANLRRPILFYTYDLEKYRDTLRGFYIDIEKDVPGPLLMTTDEVIDAILNIDEINEQYREKYDEFYQKFCHLDDGHAADKTVNQLFTRHVGDEL